MNNKELIRFRLDIEQGKTVEYQLINLNRMYKRFKLEQELEFIMTRNDIHYSEEHDDLIDIQVHLERKDLSQDCDSHRMNRLYMFN